jgi:hypothetical protein
VKEEVPMASENPETGDPAGTAVPVSHGVEAVVNPPDRVTLWSRATGLEVGSYPRDEAAALSAANPDMTPVKYDLEGASDDFLVALRVVEPVALKLIDDYKRLGYVPEGDEGAWNAALGQVQRTAQTLSLALGASLPSEHEVKSWAEHKAEHGDIDTAMYPNLARAKMNGAAVDAYVAETGGR